MTVPERQGVLWDAMRGALVTRALAVVADVGVADALADGPLPVAEIARLTGADAETLNRLLRALASDGIFAETDPGVYRNTDASDLLREPGRRAFAHLFGGAWHRAAADLTALSGDPTFEQAFGTEFWTWLKTHPDERAAFDRAMTEGAERRADRLAAIEWRDGETVVDIGGGNGSLLLELSRRRPGLRGIVLDLPETNRDEAALAAAGIEFVGGSFFERVPAGDTYVLGTVLHDWPDEQAATILSTIRTAAPAGARVLILDSVLQPGNEPDGAKWLDLLMLVLAGGRERAEPEWRTLVEDAGLRVEGFGEALVIASCP
jgi:hypothetical protein